MRDYFRSRSTIQLLSMVDNFRQHLLNHNITTTKDTTATLHAFSMNESELQGLSDRASSNNSEGVWDERALDTLSHVNSSE